MKVLMIGHSVEDHIHYKGEDKVAPGGIYYSAAALNAVKEDDDIISLNTAVQKDNYDLFKNVYDNLDKRFFRYADRIPKVYLFVHDFKERGETYENLTQNLDIDSITFDEFDGILINMITGFDITLEQLKRIRKNFPGPVFMDVHTLARGLDENLKREFRPIPDFKEWASSIDIIQTNESEMRTISSENSEYEIAFDILKTGTRMLIVTKGERGAKVYYKQGSEMVSVFKSALKVDAVNKIGCGDVFGAIFFYNYIKYGDIYKSLERANIAAGLAVTYGETKQLIGLKKDVISRSN